jgi:hypothetical protein
LRQGVVLGFIETLKADTEKQETDEPKTANGKRPRSESCGIFKGMIEIEDDFDAPLEDMKASKI